MSWIQLKLYHSSSNHIYRFILRRNHCCLFTIIFLVCPSFKSSNVTCIQTFSHIGSDTLLTCNWIISLAMLAKHAFLCFYTCKWQSILIRFRSAIVFSYSNIVHESHKLSKTSFGQIWYLQHSKEEYIILFCVRF